MSPPSPHSQALFRQLTRETEESAAVALFLDLCRTTPALRVWLFEEFARDACVRVAFARRLKVSPDPVTRFADLGAENAAWDEETRRLRERFGQRSYGGLSFDQLQELLVRHQAGHGDAAAFLLALDWQRRRNGQISPRLIRATAEFVGTAMQPRGADLLRDLARSAQLAEEFADRRRLRAAVGFTDWWKLNVLLYMLRHPAASYRTRDLHRHLVSEGLNVSPRALRQFCTENGIARDQRAGRPAAKRSERGHPLTAKSGAERVARRVKLPGRR